MTTLPETTAGRKKPGRFQLSLDGWAVALALALSLLIWMGFIKQVPW